MMNFVSDVAPRNKVSLNVSDRTVWLAFIGALIVKAVIAFVLLPHLTRYLGDNYHSDLFPDDYDLIADNLIHGRGYRVYADTSETMLRSPGFVLILAAIFAVCGKSLLAVQVVQYFMSAATAVVVYLISQRLFQSRPLSMLAAGLFLFYPVTLMSETRGGTDSTLTLFLTVTIWLLLRSIDRRSPGGFALTGLALGYTMLVKASVALIFPFVFLFLIASPSTYGSFWIQTRNFAIAAVLAAAVMAPWVIRNYAISGQFVPTMTVAGLAVFQGEEAQRNIGNGEDSWQLLDDAAKRQTEIGHEMGLRMHDDFFPQFYTPQDEVAFYRELSRRAWQAYRQDPALLVRTVIHNAWGFWFQGRTGKATLLNVVMVAPFLLLSIGGAVWAVRRQPKSWIVVISIITFVLPHLVIIAVARYCSAVIPLMCPLAAGLLLAPFAQPVLIRQPLRA